MGWENPEIPWRELERRLSGRPAPADSRDPALAGDGGDSPAWSRKREHYVAAPVERPTTRVPYAELHAHSSFSFLDGASSPEELAEEAVRLGLEALTLTDHDGVYGLVRFAEAAEAHGLATAFGAELSLDVPLPSSLAERSIAARVGVPDPPGEHLLVLARDPTGYAAMSRAIGTAHLRGGAKGRPVYDELEDLGALADGHWLVLTGCRKGSVRQALDRGGPVRARRALDRLITCFGRENVAVELIHELDPLADERFDALAELADTAGLPIVATTAAHYHGPPRRPLATALAAVRARSSLDEIDGWLPSWSGQHLRSGDEMAARFARWPGAVDNAVRLAREITFPLQLIAPDLPPFPVPAGHTEMTYLRELTYAGAAKWFRGKPHETEAYAMIEHELAIIEELHFPGYFLVVWDIARFCRSKGILCQGRGSAANSAVCYALEITAVDAVYYGLMFERFLAPERGEPPDIDLDIESDRREEAIQYVYELHGREHAAQVANVITYRPKSAVRDIAKALGYSPGQQDAWSKEIERGYYWNHTTDNGTLPPTTITTEQELADVPDLVVRLAAELQNAPRHLGIHSGGMVMCDRPVIEVCPVEWGRMANRSVLQWDKDDCAQIGLVKFDLLGLGMLSAIQYCFALITQHHGTTYELATIPQEAPCVYDMLCAADSIGVFQVESRAQMATLPRLKPRTFYDLACEVALIRPGPIQGDSVHPFIRRKNGEEAVTYPHPRLKVALERTYGIPLFQEQLMQIAVSVADFSPAEADRLRRAMGSKRGKDKIEAMRIRLFDGMAGNGITGAVAEQIYERIKAFAAFGFAESHSISFALLVYASSWLKLHYPAAFCAALVNAQPMGFYSPQSLVHDAKRHGVEVRSPSLAESLAGASLEPADGPSQCACLDAPQPAVRLGLSSIRTIGTELAEAIVASREAGGPFTSMSDLSRRVGLSADQMEALATAGALDCFGGTRRDALWGAGAASTARPGQLDLATFDEKAPAALPAMTAPEQLIADMWATGVTPELYPTALIRPRLDALGIVTARGLRSIDNRTRVTVGGVVTHRQRPATARGVTFLNLEDETGMVNVIVEEAVWHRYRRVARESGGLLIRGMLENTSDGVINVLAERIDRLHLGLHTRSRDFR
ncbi:MAG TPA: error-prone DNA polymerase [Jatrophihabitans sp.]|jgi:error-prone DNA polymerase|uniref:error-prone DNA polymerase n=1 Tax=Jatrophihabitans sp. TaxID=1932789 RepID=UPI002E0317AC|nr:error-prone DNA polymerase [Jatrophihabitans sp.]